MNPENSTCSKCGQISIIQSNGCVCNTFFYRLYNDDISIGSWVKFTKSYSLERHAELISTQFAQAEIADFYTLNVKFRNSLSEEVLREYECEIGVELVKEIDITVRKVR